MSYTIYLRAGALVALLTLAACGSSTSASPPKPTAVPTNARQAVVVATLPKGPTNKHLQIPTADPKITPAALPTVRPIPTMTPIPPSAYTAVVFGTVLDKKTNTPVPGALVTVGTGQRSGRTSAYGAYRFTFPAAVPMPVTVSAPGYTGALAMGLLRPHQKYKLDFRLVRIIPGKVPVPPPPTTFGHP
jgi:Carboxypeptidase regulatory-like domain